MRELADGGAVGPQIAAVIRQFVSAESNTCQTRDTTLPFAPGGVGSRGRYCVNFGSIGGAKCRAKAHGSGIGGGGRPRRSAN